VLVRAFGVWSSALLAVQPGLSSSMAQNEENSILTRVIAERDHEKFLHDDVRNFIKNQGFAFGWVTDLQLAQLVSPDPGPQGFGLRERITFLLHINYDTHTLRYTFSLERRRVDYFNGFDKKWHELKPLDPKDDTPKQIQEQILEKLRQQFIS
jgi:hypothetical protein